MSSVFGTIWTDDDYDLIRMPNGLINADLAPEHLRARIQILNENTIAANQRIDRRRREDKTHQYWHLRNEE